MSESAVKHAGKTPERLRIDCLDERLDHPATGETYAKGVYRWIKDPGITDLGAPIGNRC